MSRISVTNGEIGVEKIRKALSRVLFPARAEGRNGVVAVVTESGSAGSEVVRRCCEEKKWKVKFWR